MKEIGNNYFKEPMTLAFSKLWGFSTPCSLGPPGGVLFVRLSFETYVIYEFLDWNDYN